MNPRPDDYESSALPLSYLGPLESEDNGPHTIEQIKTNTCILSTLVRFLKKSNCGVNARRTVPRNAA